MYLLRKCFSPVLKKVSLLILVSAASAQSPVVLNPTSDQTISSTKYQFILNGTGTLPGTSLFGGTYSTGYVYTTSSHSYDCGYSGTSCSGSSVNHSSFPVFASGTRGIQDLYGGIFSHYAIGDSFAKYVYSDVYGGAVAGSDEGAGAVVDQIHQIGYMKGTITSGGGLSSSLIHAAITSCTGYCSTQAGSYQYADGGILLDYSNPISSTTLSAQGIVLNSLYYTLDSGTVPVSTAWGNIVVSSCINNGNGTYLATTTCNVTLGTTPASPGNFTTGSNIFLSGPYEEEAVVTAVGTPASGVQSVTFQTNVAWNNVGGNTNSAVMMQGGPGGWAFTQSTGPPIAYFVVGAVSPTQLLFGNCVKGICNGITGGGYIPSTALATAPGSISRVGGVVTLTLTGGYPYTYGVGSTIVITGFTPTDLNGSYTVVSNTNNSYSPKITWTQSGADENSTVSGMASTPEPSITFYHSAFICGINGGVSGDAQLCANSTNWNNGDVVLGAPAAEVQIVGHQLYVGQTTGVDGGQNSRGFSVRDDGPSASSYLFGALQNFGSSGQVGHYMLYSNGAWDDYIWMQNRPANNGCMLCTQGSDTNGVPKPYNVWQDLGSEGGGGALLFSPGVNLSTPNAFAAYSLTATSLTAGQCLQTSTGGAITTTGFACGTGKGAVSTVTVTAADGTGATVSVVGNSQAGVISLKTGTAIPSGGGVIVNTVFGTTFSSAPQGCTIMPRNSISAAITTSLFTTAPSTTSWAIQLAPTSALSASNSYAWSYSCI